MGKSFTCWPVLTEAAYLARSRLGLANPSQLFELVSHRELELATLDLSDLRAIQDVYSKYHDQQVDLADAALLTLAERMSIHTIFTTDRRHFRLYTLRDGTPLQLLPDDLYS